MATVISAAWPHHTEVAAPTDLFDAFSKHQDTQQELVKSREPQLKGPPRLDAYWRIARQSAPATAALLTMARHSVRLPAGHLGKQLTELLGNAPSRNHPRWGGVLEAISVQRCSTQIRLLLRGHLADRPTRPLRNHGG
ncbi:hypothetical protein OG252_50715 [Streptomyces sp. NBC_01352]|uniref:hypothetical protein n=1 Tax=Streptomyces sp. NBC_01352 TaxID=2903834 RepID=UPI002E361FC6|nr:hypothetical protein [Streptomyces sp. NBC_01352]